MSKQILIGMALLKFPAAAIHPAAINVTVSPMDCRTSPAANTTTVDAKYRSS